MHLKWLWHETAAKKTTRMSIVYKIALLGLYGCGLRRRLSWWEKNPNSGSGLDEQVFLTGSALPSRSFPKIRTWEMSTKVLEVIGHGRQVFLNQVCPKIKEIPKIWICEIYRNCIQILHSYIFMVGLGPALGHLKINGIQSQHQLKASFIT